MEVPEYAHSLHVCESVPSLAAAYTWQSVQRMKRGRQKKASGGYCFLSLQD